MDSSIKIVFEYVQTYIWKKNCGRFFYGILKVAILPVKSPSPETTWFMF